MSHQSLDPRMNRIELPMEAAQPFEEGELLQWQTYEVFQQRRRGEQHVHVGAVHAPNPDMALVLAKEQFGRREQCANLWVVRSAEVHATPYEDADMFLHAFDKSYREGDGYKVKVTIETFKKHLYDMYDQFEKEHNSHEKPAPVAKARTEAGYKMYELPDMGQGERKILVKK